MRPTGESCNGVPSRRWPGAASCGEDYCFSWGDCRTVVRGWRTAADAPDCDVRGSWFVDRCECSSSSGGLCQQQWSEQVQECR